MTPSYADFTKFSEETVATIVKTNTAVVKGFDLLTKYFNTLVTSSVEDAVVAGKKVSEVKTVSDFIDVQTKLVQASFETFSQESKKAAELTLAIAKDITEPFTERFKAGVAVATKTAAKTAKAAA